MSALIVPISEEKINPLYPAYAENYPAHREYELVRRAILRCGRCGNVARGPKIHRARHCPLCGAEVGR